MHGDMQLCSQITFSSPLPCSDTIQLIGTVGMDDASDNEIQSN
jgi:hypothetical protein